MAVVIEYPCTAQACTRAEQVLIFARKRPSIQWATHHHLNQVRSLIEAMEWVPTIRPSEERCRSPSEKFPRGGGDMEDPDAPRLQLLDGAKERLAISREGRVRPGSGYDSR